MGGASFYWEITSTYCFNNLSSIIVSDMQCSRAAYRKIPGTKTVASLWINHRQLFCSNLTIFIIEHSSTGGTHKLFNRHAAEPLHYRDIVHSLWRAALHRGSYYVLLQHASRKVLLIFEYLFEVDGGTYWLTVCLALCTLHGGNLYS